VNNRYTYWDRSGKTKRKIIEVIAENVFDADEAFEKQFGYNPKDILTITIGIDLDMDNPDSPWRWP